MIEQWAVVTLGAAALQCTRTALQKRLRGQLSTNGANLVRYIFGAPLAAVAFLIALQAGGAMPTPNAAFFLNALVGGIAQIVATSLLINALSHNFTVGTAYSKTEALQAAILSAIFVGEIITPLGWTAIFGGAIGVFLLSVPRWPANLAEARSMFTGRGAIDGIASGFCFGVSAIFFREATIDLTDTDRLTASLATLATATSLQLTLFLPYVLMREPGQVGRIFTAWRPAALVGLLSVMGSAGWFYAFAIQNAAYVRALGQAELVFTFLTAVLFFRERLGWRETLGVMVIVASVIAILLVRA
ncbi:EamA family transporter [Lacibacterium aquatile]|uniref:EamA family transporter n=1 Tax=Lacibacterium aquatile TaxID=1168082 RepID=A0ABW5DPP2_9PROT